MRINIKSALIAFLSAIMCVVSVGCTENNIPEGSFVSANNHTSTSESRLENGNVSSTTSEETTSKSSESKEIPLLTTEGDLGKTDEHGALIPKTGAKLPDDTPLNIVIINGIEFYILTATVQDIAKEGGIVHNSGYSFQRDIDAIEHYFFGEGFTVGFNADNVVQIEALRGGLLVTKNAWKSQLDNEAEVYSDYEVKGVSYGRYAEDEGFVQFCGGINIGMYKDEIDSILGRGYEVAITNNALLTSVSYYKTASTTMVIEYEKARDQEKAFTITVIKN